MKTLTHKETHALAHQVAAIIGATVEESPNDMWRATVITPDGIRLHFSTWNKKAGEVFCYVQRGATGRDSVKCGEIGVSFARGAEAVAKDIERRLLPVAREKAAKARAKWREQDAQQTGLEALAASFSGRFGVRATVENPGSENQQLKINYYETGKGSVSATITPRGSVYLNSVSLSDSGNQPDKLKALIALLAEA
jgi:hypothetical protein